MQHIQVQSSNLASIGWEHDVLEVTFKNSGTYVYAGVPRAEFDALMAAESKGSHFQKFVRPN